MVQQPSLPQDADVVGDSLHVGEDVAGEHHRGRRPHGVDELEDLRATRGVEGGGGFVEDHQLRAGDQSAGQAQPLRHPAGEAANPPVGGALQAGCLQGPADGTGSRDAVAEGGCQSYGLGGG